MVKTALTYATKLFCTELTFQVGGLSISAKRWGNGAGRRVLALHGWLDNCASFDFLAQELDEVDLVCIDCIGHGRSDFRPHLGAYNVWQDTHLSLIHI